MPDTSIGQDQNRKAIAIINNQKPCNKLRLQEHMHKLIIIKKRFPFLRLCWTLLQYSKNKHEIKRNNFSK